jgi:hypothetical protein
MRTTLACAALVGALLFVLGGTSVGGEKKKEVTLKGTITCAKCDLGIVQGKCATVIVTKEDGKDQVYFLDAKSDKANHKEVCSASKPGSVTGTVSEKDGKKMITAKKVTFD